MKGRWSKKKLGKALDVIADAIGRYRPDVLAIKRLHPSRTSRGLESFVLQLRRSCLRNRVEIVQYTIKQLEEYFCREGQKNKKSLAESVAAMYPELYSELNIEYPEPKPGEDEKHKTPYHIKMFEAVALGAICADKFDNH